MTIFDLDDATDATDATVSSLNARRSLLPQPTRERFQPLRAGITNVWEYDDQQFWFADGRLLLRGRNEAGKSKVLELLFPFVLDGDMSPKKLDPFDTVSKSMRWNMVDFDKANRKNPIGYLWVEFGRTTPGRDGEYLTVIVGMQASSGERKVTPWFAVTPQRIDLDLDLAPGDLPMNADAFSKALAPEARFATRASEHRTNVATHLFSMRPERYDNLLHLLRQLRKPKLADKLNNAKLAAVLADALPPIDESQIAHLAEGFGHLDEHIEQLAQAEAGLRATGAFLDLYRAYARSVVRQRADQVRSAITVFDDVTKKQTANRQKLTDAQVRVAALDTEARQIGHDLADASGALQGLDLSAVESLNSLREVAEERANVVAHAQATFDVCADAEARATARVDAEQSRADRRSAEMEAAQRDARVRADRVGLPRDWERPVDDVPSDLIDQTHRLAAAAAGKRALVEAVRSADERAGEARKKIALAEQRAQDTAGRLAEATDALAAAEREAESQRGSFVDDLERWAASGPGETSRFDAEDLTDQIAGQLPNAERAARDAGARLSGPARSAAADRLHSATRTAGRADDELAAARSALAEHDAAGDDAPPPQARAGVPGERSGTPLWYLVDFDDDVTASDAAQIEAALDAAGLLDAVVTEHGLRDSATEDTVVVSAPAGEGLTAWLRPAVNDKGVDTNLVDAVLRTIGAGPDQSRACWVERDGSWANGPLRGRWSKPTAERIGAGARREARVRQRAILVANVADAETRAAVADQEVRAAQRGADAVDAWRDEFPEVGDWVDAERNRDRAFTTLNRADREDRDARDKLQTARDAAASLLEAVATAITAAGCRPEQVPDALEKLAAVADAAVALRTAAQRLTEVEDRLREAIAELEDRAAAAAQAEGHLREATLVSREATSRYETARRVSGAEVDAILAEKERLDANIVALKRREGAVRHERNTATEDVARADAELAETGRLREAALVSRNAAYEALVEVVSAGHASLVIALDADREPADYLQWTAGRNLARQIAAAVPAEAGTTEASEQAEQRLMHGMRPFQDAVGVNFNPHQEKIDGLWRVSATLNGELVDIATLHAALVDDVEQRQRSIAADERALIEQHLRDKVGDHLGNCLHSATTQVKQMNAILKDHPTNSGSLVQLNWQVDADAGPAVKDAVAALLMSPQTRDAQASAVLATFLTERVALARRGDIDGADLTERLTAALDYRLWHTFKLNYRTRNDDGDLTSTRVGSGSGGQQAKIAHQPLLAAAAGFYASSPTAPRLCFLDEAFAGIDGPNTDDLLAMTVTLDLDMVMTNFDAWFCTPNLPGLAIYQLAKTPGVLGVAAMRWEWDGTEKFIHDPWHDA